MFYRISAFATFAVSVWVLVWNAWFRQSVSGDAVVGEAFTALAFSAAVFVAALFVVLFPNYRPQDRYWGYATIGLVIGFWLQR